jgi:hypothetical protein
MLQLSVADAFNRADDIERHAYADVFSCAMNAAKSSGIAHSWSGHLLNLVCPAYPKINVHRIAGLHSELPHWKLFLDQAIGSLVVGQGIDARSGDDALIQELSSRGLTSTTRYAKHVRGSSPTSNVATDLPIRELGSRDARAYELVLRASFGHPDPIRGWFGSVLGRPGWHSFGVFARDQIVAVGALYVRNGNGWLGFDATLPSFRGLRLQRAIIAARIAVVAQIGVELLTCETLMPGDKSPAPSYANFLRAGFEVGYERHVFKAPTP